MTWQAHWDEFTGYLADPTCIVLVAEMHGLPVGTVRFDARSDHRELSYTVAPEMRNLGYAKQMVSRACADLGGDRIVAEIKPTNEASVRVVRTCGFRKTGAHGELEIWELPAASAPD
jgi:RimJ/RimL family protein N-acetyltransferase